MKYKYFLVGTLIALYVQANAQKNSLKVIIEGVKTDRGEILIGLYNSEKTFLKVKYKGEKVKARKGEVSIILKDLPTGEYGLAVIHDEDSNGKFNSNFLGFPTEGFGFSNNAKGILGPPSFSKAKFIMENQSTESLEQAQSISLRYL